jgi:putative membrane protein
MLRLVLAWAHLIALGIGLGAVWARGSSLREPPDERSASRALAADTWWGIAAALWIVTGLWRLLAGTEKAASYYMHNQAFMLKMTLLVVILVLEIWPMATLIHWRIERARKVFDVSLHAHNARRIAIISFVQAALVAAMVWFSVAMARGYGVRA